MNLYEFTLKTALPDQAIELDKIPWVPTFDGVWFKPIRFDLATGTFAHLTKITPNSAGIKRHRHTGGQVFAYTLQGQWRYLERTWVAKPGMVVYEPPGDIHTLVVDGEEEMITLFIIGGVIEYIDDDDKLILQDDVFYRMKKYADFCSQNNIPMADLCY
ncbi:2,4'-dihydroxyacetophenone dioxygenase family protein [Paenibacillus alginolyticus]|uniref:2,4'-dihydroxyacetophenone dioxygenase family protein n=1 Tax=Paenibacillus alginolyticus TaxID=59839 RepID=UPI000421254E|nr:2,4'-dihydroxyacetophenone dioxygenase family protein [Paenibacillus alginolyticus]MCY9669231.1 2,4'-dihydroxyacetophenone dioxygenase family protein [Paenibacillus alginolyticus]